MKRLLTQLARPKGAYVSEYCQVNNDTDLTLWTGGHQVMDRMKKDCEVPEDLVMCEYIWHGASQELRGKMRCIYVDPNEELTVEHMPSWSYDGSSTAQASGGNSDVGLKPVAIYPDPFRGGRHQLVLCETWFKGEPHPTNTRTHCAEVFDLLKDEEWVMAFEQEYILYHNGRPLGWPADGSFPYYEQGPYYCAVGPQNALARDFGEAHFLACLHAGLRVEGINAEVMFGQWEYQVGGPEMDKDGNIIGGTGGLEVADELEISRYIMHRIGEEMNLCVEIHPKPITEGAWNGSGNHCNASTKPMREKGGIKDIEDAVEKLRDNHWRHVYEYGYDNHYRLSGLFETQFIGTFSYAPGDRGSSIRVQTACFERGYGWLEDRRPSSNCDPYAVTSRIAKTVAGLSDEDFGKTSEDLTYFIDTCNLIADGKALPLEVDPWAEKKAALQDFSH